MAFKRKNLFILLRLMISFGLIGYFLYTLAKQYDGLGEAMKQFASAFSGASPGWLISAFFLHIVGFSLISLRWKILLKAQGINSAYGKLFSYYFMATFFNTFLPSTIGGDTVRAMEEGMKVPGKLFSGFDFEKIAKIVRDFTGLIKTHCLDCDARFLCHRCYIHFAKNGVFTVDPAFCENKRKVFKSLEKLIRKEGTVGASVRML